MHLLCLHHYLQVLFSFFLFPISVTKLVSYGDGISYDTDSSDNEDKADDDAMEIDSEVGDEETRNKPVSSNRIALVSDK